MQKKTTKRLILDKITVANLSLHELRQAVGGRMNPTISACKTNCEITDVCVEH